MLIINIKIAIIKLIYLSSIKSAKFKNTVQPGDQLLIKAELANFKLGTCKIKSRIYVDNKLIDPGIYFNLNAAKEIMRKQTEKANFGVDDVAIQAPDQEQIGSEELTQFREEFKLKEEEKKAKESESKKEKSDKKKNKNKDKKVKKEEEDKKDKKEKNGI